MTDNAVRVASSSDSRFAKVPAVTLGFWIIKIAATTLGETGGDTVSMTMNLGYLIGTAIFFSILIVMVGLQIAAKKFPPLSLLGNHRRVHDMWHDARRFRRSFARDWISGRVTAAVHLCVDKSRRLVLGGGNSFGSDGQHTACRSVLLAHHHFFPDARHGAWRLGG